jgi:hypothetical protein
MNEYPSTPAGKTALSAAELRELRKEMCENQTRFWKRFGVSQSRGSRFELGMEMPFPVAILLSLYLDGAVSDKDLHSARTCPVLRQSATSQISTSLSQR